MKIIFLLLAFVAAVCATVDQATNRLWVHTDSNRDGFLSESELTTFLNDCDGYSIADHQVTENEFYHCVLHNNHYIRPYSHIIFKAFDVHHHHIITISDSDVTDIVHKFDTDGNGVVSQMEFETYIKNHIHLIFGFGKK